MPSFEYLAKVVAGTYVADSPAPNHPVTQWIQKECREGSLSESVVRFARDQQEFLDPSLVLVEAVDATHVTCVIPCRICDHESKKTFKSEVRFRLDPATGTAERLLVA